MKLEAFIIENSSTVLEVLQKIESNQRGFVFLSDARLRIIGMCTDGDIRRRLMEGITVDEPILSCINSSFVSATIDTPRELLLKQLDHKIKVIPVLDEMGRLVSIVTRDYWPEKQENKVFARAKSPVRISFGGGGSDVSAYFDENRAAVINSTISLYSHATMRLREDGKISIRSLDLNDSVHFESIEELNTYSGKFSLIVSVIRSVNPPYGFDLHLYSDYPMSSGLGGSAVVSSAVLGCFNQFRNDQWDKYDIAEIAFHSERLSLGIAGGWQDQYATVFGGFNFMEFNSEQNIITPIRLSNSLKLDLEESLLLCYTGTTHDSGDIHVDQKEQTRSIHIKDRIKANVGLSYEMRDHLLRGRLDDFGRCIHRAWELKRGLSSKISNSWIDGLYQGAIENGALGGKILGAGGGGFFLFYVRPFDRINLVNWLRSEGLTVTSFTFENEGLQSWKVREI